MTHNDAVSKREIIREEVKDAFKAWHSGAKLTDRQREMIDAEMTENYTRIVGGVQ